MKRSPCASKVIAAMPPMLDAATGATMHSVVELLVQLAVLLVGLVNVAYAPLTKGSLKRCCYIAR